MFWGKNKLLLHRHTCHIDYLLLNLLKCCKYDRTKATALGDALYLIPVKFTQIYKIKSNLSSQQKSIQLQWIDGKAMPELNVKWKNNLMSKNNNCCIVSLPCSSGETLAATCGRRNERGTEFPSPCRGERGK